MLQADSGGQKRCWSMASWPTVTARYFFCLSKWQAAATWLWTSRRHQEAVGAAKIHCPVLIFLSMLQVKFAIHLNAHWRLIGHAVWWTRPLYWHGDTLNFGTACSVNNSRLVKAGHVLTERVAIDGPWKTWYFAFRLLNVRSERPATNLPKTWIHRGLPAAWSA